MGVSPRWHEAGPDLVKGISNNNVPLRGDRNKPHAMAAQSRRGIMTVPTSHCCAMTYRSVIEAKFRFW